MKPLLLFLLLTTNNDPFDDFRWLIGKWQNADTPEAFEEWWWNTDKGHLQGRGYRIVVGDTLVFERLSIEYLEGTPHFISDVQENDGPVPFKMTLWDNKGFISENTKHDFPKSIAYKNKGSRIDAVIFGNGKELEFKFKRVR